MSATERSYTRDDAEAEIRAITRTCLGPRAQGVVPVLESLLAKRRFPLAEEIRAPLAEVARAIEAGELEATTDAALSALFAAGAEQAARRLGAETAEGCGADFNDVIVAGPWDGEEHAFSCPRCGREGWYRAPRYALAEETPAA